MKNLIKEQLAELLNGREYREEITKEEELLAKDNNLVVIYGQSDDLLEYTGAAYGELGCFEGANFKIALDGEFYADSEEENTYHKAEGNEIFEISDEYDLDDEPRLIRAEWSPTDSNLSWHIDSNIPHASFTIYEDGEPYCEGIVIDIDEVNELSRII